VITENKDSVIKSKIVERINDIKQQRIELIKNHKELRKRQVLLKSLLVMYKNYNDAQIMDIIESTPKIDKKSDKCTVKNKENSTPKQDRTELAAAVALVLATNGNAYSVASELVRSVAAYNLEVTSTLIREVIRTRRWLFERNTYASEKFRLCERHANEITRLMNSPVEEHMQLVTNYMRVNLPKPVKRKVDTTSLAS
jgi:hypothetical protein